jgi:hypothetical protein
LAPWKFSFLKILARNSGPFLQGAPQLGEKDLAKILRAGNSEISGPQKFWMLRISGPPLQAAPHPVVKDLAEFSRARNYELSGPQKFCQTRIYGPFTACCTTTFSKGPSRISGPRKFCLGAEILALGAEFLALKANFRP